jgi:hypothetical protein
MVIEPGTWIKRIQVEEGAAGELGTVISARERVLCLFRVYKVAMNGGYQTGQANPGFGPLIDLRRTDGSPKELIVADHKPAVLEIDLSLDYDYLGNVLRARDVAPKKPHSGRVHPPSAN